MMNKGKLKHFGLDLYFNKVEFEGARALSRFLPVLTQVETLHFELPMNNLTNEGGELIGKGL